MFGLFSNKTALEEIESISRRETVRAREDRHEDDLARQRREHRVATRDTNNAATAAAVANQQIEITRKIRQENQALREQLERATGLARIGAIDSKGLIDTIKHLQTLKQSAGELAAGEMQALVNEKIEKAKNNDVLRQKICQEIDDRIKNVKRVGPKRG